MKKNIFLLILWINSFSLFSQNQTIDLQGVFTGKYRTEGYLSLSWRPGTNQFTFLKNNNYDTLFVQEANAKTPVALLTKSKLRELLPDKQSINMLEHEWLDQNTLYFSGLKTLIVLNKGNFQVKGFPLEDKTVLNYDAKNGLFVIKENDGNVFVLSERNNFSPILLCPDTGMNIVFGEAVHRNEWGINEGEYIAPSGKYIAFYRMDESMVDEYPLVNTDELTATVEMIRYPMAGRRSHEVKVGIFDVERSVQQNKPVYHYIKTELADGEFLTNVTFSPHELFLYITHVNREQNCAKLVEYDLLT
ncbi:MAG: DPP IV N-terminal domain-containing protein, partial [Bacteroidales bacterium]|nr:DPP IV N-terminal domain-containing protein [Bacteroidales bacterium]